MLIGFSEDQALPEVGTVTAEDQMDDGSPIRVRRPAPSQASTFLVATPKPALMSSARAGNPRSSEARPCGGRLRAASQVADDPVSRLHGVQGEIKNRWCD